MLSFMRIIVAGVLLSGVIIGLTACEEQQKQVASSVLGQVKSSTPNQSEILKNAEQTLGVPVASVEDTGAPGIRAEDFTLTYSDLYRKTDIPENTTDTVLSIPADAENSQILYLWEEGNVPAVTKYTSNNGNYFDEPDFRPYLTSVLVPEGTEIKGAILLCAGGAFSFRGNYGDTLPTAWELSKRGYQCFVVDYRLRPYRQEEGALDLARAVRFVRKNAGVYGIDEKDIAVMGFSAGGIQAGEMLLNYDGLVNGTALDSDYVPDELDAVSADAAAAGMIYSFYGRLSVASTDVEKFATSDLPPTYFCYGTKDTFVREFEKCIEALGKAGVPVRYQVLHDTPHGFGEKGGWIPQYDTWLTEIFANN